MSVAFAFNRLVVEGGRWVEMATLVEESWGGFCFALTLVCLALCHGLWGL